MAATSRMRIRLGPQACGTLDESALREWLVTDGARRLRDGHRRRAAHAALPRAARGRGSAGRRRGCSGSPRSTRCSSSATPGIRLATDEWARGDVDPRGHELLVSFELDDGVPRWRWQVGGIVLERELAMAHGRAAVGVVHRLSAPTGRSRLELTPLCTWRSVHGERCGYGEPEVEHDRRRLRLRGRLPRRRRRLDAGGEWYRGVRAREEAARGLNDRRGHVGGGHVRRRARAGRGARGDGGRGAVRRRAARGDEIVAAARERAPDAVAAGRRRRRVDAQLVLAADQFVIDDGGPDGGRRLPVVRRVVARPDDLVRGALPLDRPRATRAARCCARRRRPSPRACSRTPPTRDRSSTTRSTATLWFVHAVGRHVAVTGDDDLGAELAPGARGDRRSTTSTARASASASIRPTACCARAPTGWALTWMDARIDGVPVTPRMGKPVEVNALWIEALEIAARLARDRPRRRLVARGRAGRSRSSRRFARADGRGLLDVVDGPGGDDPSVRPNQLLAARCPRPAASPTSAARPRAVEACAPLADAARAPLARAGRPAYRAHHRGSPGRARRRLPPGHRLAVADRAVRRCGPARRCRDGRARRRPRGAPRRVGPRVGLRDGRRRGPACRRRAAPSRRGRWPRCCASGRRSLTS